MAGSAAVVIEQAVDGFLYLAAVTFFFVRFVQQRTITVKRGMLWTGAINSLSIQVVYFCAVDRSSKQVYILVDI